MKSEPDSENSAHKVLKMLPTYLYLATATIVTQPLLARFIQHYCLVWRMVLMSHYLRNWEVALSDVEGASQRVQEDTKKFGDGLEKLFEQVASAIFACILFSPYLAELGEKMNPTWVPEALKLNGWWLCILVFLLPLGGLVVTSCVSKQLLRIDIDNQRVEAAYRKQLVSAEGGGAQAVPMRLQVDQTPPFSSLLPAGTDGNFPKASTPSEDEDAPARVFETTRGNMATLMANYTSMYNNFLAIGVWNTTFAQLSFLGPTALGAPFLFAVDSNFGLGDLQLLRFLFIDVFATLNTFARNWADINELRATVVRLREFEAAIKHNGEPAWRKQQKQGAGSDLL